MKNYAYIKTSSFFSNFSFRACFINQLIHQVQYALGEQATHGSRNDSP